MVDKINQAECLSLIKNSKGQAVFEMIIFLPFLLFLYSIYYTTGNSINGSINQQKAVRGYFYQLTKGNSYINTFSELADFSNKTIPGVGFSAVGWREKSGMGSNAEQAFAPCFEFSSLLKNNSNESCDSGEHAEGSSRFIRVFTFYGVCGPVYSEVDDPGTKFYEIKPNTQNRPELCSLMASPPS